MSCIETILKTVDKSMVLRKITNRLFYSMIKVIGDFTFYYLLVSFLIDFTHMSYYEIGLSSDKVLKDIKRL